MSPPVGSPAGQKRQQSRGGGLVPPEGLRQPLFAALTKRRQAVAGVGGKGGAAAASAAAAAAGSRKPGRPSKPTGTAAAEEGTGGSAPTSSSSSSVPAVAVPPEFVARAFPPAPAPPAAAATARAPAPGAGGIAQGSLAGLKRPAPAAAATAAAATPPPLPPARSLLSEAAARWAGLSPAELLEARLARESGCYPLEDAAVRLEPPPAPTVAAAAAAGPESVPPPPSCDLRGLSAAEFSQVLQVRATRSRWMLGRKGRRRRHGCTSPPPSPPFPPALLRCGTSCASGPLARTCSRRPRTGAASSSCRRRRAGA